MILLGSALTFILLKINDDAGPFSDSTGTIIGGNAIYVSDQTPGGRVAVGLVYLEKPGFVVIREKELLPNTLFDDFAKFSENERSEKSKRIYGISSRSFFASRIENFAKEQNRVFGNSSNNKNAGWGAVLGASALLAAGETKNLLLTLHRPAYENETLDAMLYIDDGDGLFDPDKDTPAIDQIGGEAMTTIFTMSKDFSAPAAVQL